MAMFQDDSTDDEACCYLQLGERLRINRGERPSTSKKTMNGKDLKQLYNQQRRRHFIDEQSSSSSSQDVLLDPSIPGPTNAYGLKNKKRQNGDKTIDQFANPKRTCLGNTFRKPPGWKDCKKNVTNGIPYSRKIMDFSSEQPNSSARNLFPDKTYEDHLNDLSDAEDSDFEQWEWDKNKKQLLNKTIPQCPGLYENPPPGNQGVQFVDSASEDDSRMPIGALKGGRQSPDPTFKKVLGRKVKKVLDSDDSDSEDWQVCYRNRPLIFSSSDSEDERPGKKAKNKSSDIVTKTSANLSFSSGDSQKSSYDHSYHKTGDSELKLNGDSPDIFVSSAPSRTQYRTRSPYKSYKTRSSGRVNGQPAHMFQDFSSIGPDIGGNPTVHEIHSKNPGIPHPKTLRGHRVHSDTTSRGGSDSQTKTPNSTADLYNEGNSRDIASSSISSSAFLPCQVASPYQSLDGNHSRRQPKFVRGISRKLPDTSISSRRRTLSQANSLKTKPSLAAAYPDLFDAEDSSEVEFFTANSYSDNESNTESLNRIRLPITSQPLQNSEVRTDPSVNVGSSEDEISVVFSSGPRQRSPHPRINAMRARTRTLVPGMRVRGLRRRSHLSHAQDVSLSPDPVEQVRQVEEDERFARMLQAQFDAEVDPTFVPRPHVSPNPCQMNIREATSSDDDASNLDAQVEDMFQRERALLNPYSFPLPNTQSFPVFSPISSPEHPNFNLRFNVNAAHSGTFRNRRRLPERLTAHESHWDPWFRNVSSFNHLFPFEGHRDTYEAFLGLAEMNGDVPRGLQKTEINRLPTRKYAVPNGASSSTAAELPHKRAELNKECQVCLNDYVNGDVLRILPCFHEFHTPCIDPWLKINHTCPVCRVVVDLDE